jgi:hypothetical protein
MGKAFWRANAVSILTGDVSGLARNCTNSRGWAKLFRGGVLT